jgi:hypothetical protein
VENPAFVAVTLALRTFFILTRATADAGFTIEIDTEKTPRCKKQMETADYLPLR